LTLLGAIFPSHHRCYTPPVTNDIRKIHAGAAAKAVQLIDSVKWQCASKGANHQWRKNPPGELSIDPVADERHLDEDEANLNWNVAVGMVRPDERLRDAIEWMRCPPTATRENFS
jgi:hypothetical protein